MNNAQARTTQQLLHTAAGGSSHWHLQRWL
jgi:hypothetical protein